MKLLEFIRSTRKLSSAVFSREPTLQSFANNLCDAAEQGSSFDPHELARTLMRRGWVIDLREKYTPTRIWQLILRHCDSLAANDQITLITPILEEHFENPRNEYSHEFKMIWQTVLSVNISSEHPLFELSNFTTHPEQAETSYNFLLYAVAALSLAIAITSLIVVILALASVIALPTAGIVATAAVAAVAIIPPAYAAFKFFRTAAESDGEENLIPGFDTSVQGNN